MMTPLTGVRLRVLGPLCLVAGALVLSACGSDDSDEPIPPDQIIETPATTGADEAQSGSVDQAAAEKIALAAVGAGTVTDSGPEDDRGAAWEVEITRPDGREVDVLVAADGSVIDQIEKGQGDTPDGAGGQGQKAGGQAGGGGQGTVSRQQAGRAALAHIGTGSVTYISREDDRGAAWEVEITRPDGSEIDVLVAADGSIVK